jgi:glycosyltransferase involved in cell wall biosynthesis
MENRGMKKISFVVPCYRSQNTISKVVKEIVDTMNEMTLFGYEIVLVNDASPDNTFDIICQLAEKYSNIIGVDLAKNFGQHAALMAGLRQTTGDIIVCLDDDGQTPAAEVGKLIDKIESGYDVVYASYDHKQHSAFRNLGSYANGKMTEVLLGKPKGLAVTSYFAMKRFVMEEMLRYEQCYPYIIGLVLRTTKNICNVPVHHRLREEGKSGYTWHKLFALWLNGFTSFSIKPLRCATYFGFFSAAMGFIFLISIVIRYLTENAAPTGWSSTMAVLLIIGGINLITLGLVGEYIGRTYMCINATPQYVIRQIVNKRK